MYCTQCVLHISVHLHAHFATGCCEFFRHWWLIFCRCVRTASSQGHPFQPVLCHVCLRLWSRVTVCIKKNMPGCSLPSLFLSGRWCKQLFQRGLRVHACSMHVCMWLGISVPAPCIREYSWKSIHFCSNLFKSLRILVSFEFRPYSLPSTSYCIFLNLTLATWVFRLCDMTGVCASKLG